MPTPDVILYRCSFCAASNPENERLLSCSGCRAVRYCSADHQTADWNAHKSLCVKIKRARQKMQTEENTLRNNPDNGDFMMSGNPFENHVGHFWGVWPTRDYMRARMDLVTALLKINTRDAVSASLEHLLDMLRLCRGDNLGVRDIVPGLYLRLRRDQECYDFLKWYGTQGQDADYAWGDMSLPFLNLKDEDSTESPEPMWTGRYSDTAHAVAVLMIKLRMLLDLKDFEAAAELYKLTGPTDQKLNLDIVQEIHDKVETRSGIWSKHPELLALEGMKGRIASLEQQIDRLYSAISQQNKFFWKGLAEHEKWLKLPPTPYSQGSKEEMVLLLHHHARSWIETEGSLEWAKLKLRS